MAPNRCEAHLWRHSRLATCEVGASRTSDYNSLGPKEQDEEISCRRSHRSLRRFLPVPLFLGQRSWLLSPDEPIVGEETEVWLTTDVAKISISSRKRRAHRRQPTSLPPGTMFPTDEKHVPGNDCNFSGGQLSTTCRREKPTIVEQHSSSTVDRSLVRDHS